MRLSKKYLNSSFLVAIFLVLSLLFALFLVLNWFSVFIGDRAEAIELLGIVAQGSAALTAIVFAFLTYISQMVIGKYVSGTITYLFKHRNLIVVIVFYSIATVTNGVLMWIFPRLQWNLLVDVSISLLLFQIAMLPVLFVVQSNLLNPKTIIDTLVGKPVLKNEQSIKDAMEKITVVFAMVLKLAKDKEYDAATYGLQTITKIVASDPEQNGFGLYASVIPNYERIGVECFADDPNISVQVILQFGKMVDSLEKKNPFIRANTCSAITNACYRIATSVDKKPYCEIPLSQSYLLLGKIFVSKSLADYDFSAYEELIKMKQITAMMIDANIDTYLVNSYVLEVYFKKLIDAGKDEMTKTLFTAILQLSPQNYTTAHICFNAILFSVPINKRHIAESLFEEVKVRFPNLKVEFTRTDDASRTHVGIVGDVYTVESGNKEIEEKIGWFKAKIHSP